MEISFLASGPDPWSRTLRAAQLRRICRLQRREHRRWLSMAGASSATTPPMIGLVGRSEVIAFAVSGRDDLLGEGRGNMPTAWWIPDQRRSPRWSTLWQPAADLSPPPAAVDASTRLGGFVPERRAYPFSAEDSGAPTEL